MYTMHNQQRRLSVLVHESDLQIERRQFVGHDAFFQTRCAFFGEGSVESLQQNMSVEDGEDDGAGNRTWTANIAAWLRFAKIVHGRHGAKQAVGDGLALADNDRLSERENR